jgi:hypothetical protein
LIKERNKNRSNTNSPLEKKKATLRFHLTPVRMTVIKNTQAQNAGEDAGKRNSYFLLVGM